MFSSRSFMASGLTFKFNPFQLNFCKWWKMGVQFHSYTFEDPIIPATFIKETVFFPLLPCQILVDCICLGLFLASQFCSTGLWMPVT